MIQPLVSVLLPVYNGEKFIAQAIQSILDQTYHNFEFFIIDDGSDDGTRMVVDRFHDSRIRRIYMSEHLGLVPSLNLAASNAQGKYLARMDADDVGHPDRFEKQIAFLEAHPDVGVLGTSAQQTDSRLRVISVLPMLETHERILWRFFFDTAILHPTVMMRADVFRAVGGYGPYFTRAEDTELWSRMLFMTRFANLREILHTRRLHNRSLVSAKPGAVIQATIGIRERMFFKMINRTVSPPVLRWFVDPFRLLSHEQKQELVQTFHELHRYVTRSFTLSPEIDAYIREDLERRIRIAQYSDRRPVRKFVFRLIRDILPMTTRHKLKQSKLGFFIARRI